MKYYYSGVSGPEFLLLYFSSGIRVSTGNESIILPGPANLFIFLSKLNLKDKFALINRQFLMQNNTGSLKLSSLPNFRDLCTADKSDGARLKRGLLYRSANPDRISGRDSRRLEAIGIRTVIDLRAPHEVKIRPGRLGSAERINLPLDFQGKTREKLTPILRQKEYRDEVTKISEWLYNEITDAAVPVFRAIAEKILKEDSLPMLVHCQVGKDRTGIVSALLHLVAGSSREAIISDFMRSNDELLPFFRKMLLWQRIRHLGFFPHEAVLFAVQVRHNNIEAVLDRVGGKYGGVEGYLAAGGFDISRFNELRHKISGD
jgi:protein-tyrosine phosphatase